ncbi:MAG: epoxyqueuosine reductase [Clostridia bacterium]|nr:epoxyqueuosine reductase [Clostridia bacterium]
MNLTLAQQIEERFPPYISYGVMANPNQKYRKQGYRTLIVAVFPYSYPGDARLFSRYCSVYDYHTVVKEEFDRIFAPLGIEYRSFSDISPFKEKVLAEELGLGQIGKHNLLLTERYGSFVFVGEVLLKEELPPKKHPAVSLCTGCGACQRACPTNGLTDGFCRERCLSYLSQKKELSDAEIALFQKSEKVWGCDICQLACPVNARANVTEIEKFQKPVLQLSEEEILGISEDEFREKYRDFAFAYKGTEILKRNVRLLHEKQI